MTRTRTTTIRALALAIAATFVLSIQIAAAKTKAEQQGLWVGGEKYFSEFQGKALLKSGTPKAHLAFGNADYNAPSSIVFDADQNLWTTFLDSNGLPSAVFEISQGELTSLRAGKPVKPKVIISPQKNSTVPFGFAESIGLDASGDLWVIDRDRTILELLRSQIKKSGGPTPNIVITPTVATVSKIMFDRSDNLWIVAFPTPSDPSSDQIWRFTASDRAARGPANPSLILNVPNQVYVLDLAFDNSGNLWLGGSNSDGDEIEMISASDLNGTGEVSPAAAATITSSAFTPNNPGSCLSGIDFDHSGNLWVSVYPLSFGCDNGVVEFAASQLSIGGNLTPSIIIGQNITKTNLFIPGPIRFGPTVK
jgi:ligand-binding sensor domain-containing protein